MAASSVEANTPLAKGRQRIALAPLHPARVEAQQAVAHDCSALDQTVLSSFGAQL